MLRLKWSSPLGAGIVVGLGALLCSPYTVDDAYIVGRYARHLVTDGVYAMNAPGPATDGITGPLGLLPGTLAVALGLDPVWAAKVCGGACASLAAALWIRVLRRRHDGPLAAGYAVPLLVVQPTFATWAVAGLEGGLAALLLSLCVYGKGTGPSATARGLAAGALAALRPELWPAGLILLLFGRRPSGVRLSLVLGLSGLVMVIAFRYCVFGDPVPLSVRAKPALMSNGAEYLVRALIFVSSGVGLGLVAWAARVGRTPDRVIAWALVTGLACVLLSGGDWMPGFRLLAPLLPAYAVLAGSALARIHRSRGAKPALLLCAASSLLPLVDYGLRLPEQWRSAELRDSVGRPLAQQVADLGGTLATVDVGLVPYLSGVSVLDLGGITDPAIADLPGGHLDKRVPERLVKERAPRQVLLHSRRPPQVDDAGRLLALSGYPVEQRLARMPWIINSFRVRAVVEYGPDYHYVWLVGH